MKVVVVQLALITAAFLSGERGLNTITYSARKEGRELVSDCAVPSIQLTGVAAVGVWIRVYNATGELDHSRYPFTLGTRILLTCNVTGLPENSEALSYKWYHNCTGRPNSRCEIQDRDPYYRVVKDTLLVDVTSLDQGGRYFCNADSLPLREAAITRELAVAG